MSPRRSLLAAGSLTGLVIIAVLVVGARLGAFGLSQPESVVLTADGADTAQDRLTPADPRPRSHWDDDKDDEVDDDDYETDDDDERPPSLTGADGRSGSRSPGRARHDDD
jgi:hypothetical protein